VGFEGETTTRPDHVASAGATGATGLEPSPTAPYLRGNPSNIVLCCPKFSLHKTNHVAPHMRVDRVVCSPVAEVF
jgi:hypothetical protein